MKTCKQWPCQENNCNNNVQEYNAAYCDEHLEHYVKENIEEFHKRIDKEISILEKIKARKLQAQNIQNIYNAINIATLNDEERTEIINFLMGL